MTFVIKVDFFSESNENNQHTLSLGLLTTPFDSITLQTNDLACSSLWNGFIYVVWSWISCLARWWNRSTPPLYYPELDRILDRSIHRHEDELDHPPRGSFKLRCSHPFQHIFLITRPLVKPGGPGKEINRKTPSPKRGGFLLYYWFRCPIRSERWLPANLSDLFRC